MSCPDEMYDLPGPSGFNQPLCDKEEYTEGDDGEIAASVSTERLNLMAGNTSVRRPCCNCKGPSQASLLQVKSSNHSHSPPCRWMDEGSHNGPLMPVARGMRLPVRFDGPQGLSVSDSGGCRLQTRGPVDMFDDPSLTDQGHSPLKSEYMRRHGPFEPTDSHQMKWSTHHYQVSLKNSGTGSRILNNPLLNPFFLGFCRQSPDFLFLSISCGMSTTRRTSVNHSPVTCCSNYHPHGPSVSCPHKGRARQHHQVPWTP